jgi:membrane protein DedA with SNARE-associated domain
MAHISYGSVALLMAIESSFIPFPSEIVVPPAAWKAAQGEMSIWLVFTAATAGAMVGAIVNYYLARTLGRAVLYRLADTRWAHVLLLDRRGVEKAEAYFNRHGKASTFVGRLVPAVRQLISLPAGIARMHLGTFLLFTALGAGIWNAALAALGYFLYSRKETLEQYYHLLSYALLGAGALFVAYLAYSGLKGRPKPAP